MPLAILFAAWHPCPKLLDVGAGHDVNGFTPAYLEEELIKHLNSILKNLKIKCMKQKSEIEVLLEDNIKKEAFISKLKRQ